MGLQYMLVAATIALAAATAPRGVPRSLEAAYQGRTTFTCLDTSKTIEASRVNDDFCDCADGSDEPGTSACPQGKFFCVNKGARSRFVPSSLVNDGVCDCCDGSDEWASRATCPNTCDADGRAWREQQADAIRKAEEGARLRLQYATEGTDASTQRAAKVAALTAAVEEAKAAQAAAERALAVAEDEEKAERQKRAASAASAGRAAISSALRIDNFSRDELLDLLIAHVKSTSTATSLVSALNAQRGVAADAADASSWPSDVPAAEEFKSEAGEKAREAKSTAASTLSRVEAELRTAKEDEGVDFGPDAAFYKLKGKCVELRTTQYSYSVCPFASAKQDGTSLGSFSGWGKKADGSTDYAVMQFTNGAYCWNGPNRSLRLTFECGTTEVVLGIDEPEKCTYAARMSTPAACDDKFARELRLELEHDEL